MSQIIFPDNRGRSPTAVDDKGDAKDYLCYSSVVLQHGATGQVEIFSNPKGQTIPTLAGSAITAPTSGHQLKYTVLTTSMEKAGETGSGVGELSVKGLGVTIETAYVTASSGALNTYGAGQQEVSEILAKTFFTLKVGGAEVMKGATFMFPSVGGAFGAISTTGNAATVSVLQNGWPGAFKRFRLPILIGRSDTIVGEVAVASSASLTFSVASGIGQPVLVWYTLTALRKSDVRGT